MKKISLLLALLLILMPSCVMAGQVEESLLTYESDGAVLTIDPATMAVSFTPAGSEVTYTTAVLQSTSGSRAMKNLQKSALSVQYIANALAGTISAMDSFSMSVDLGEATVERLPEGFRVSYGIGSNELVVDDLPKMIPVEIYHERLKPAWTEKNDKLFNSNYRVVPRGDGSSVFVRAKDDLGKLVISQLYELIFTQGGYTLEERDAHNAEYGHEVKTNPHLDVVMDFLVDGGDLVVSLPMNEVKTTIDNDLIAIDVLPYFLSADRAQKGYLFVPDGSGAIMNFSNDRLGIAAYSTTVYGRDPLIRADEYRPAAYPTNLPVYGIKDETGAVLCIIEEGAELATITADIAGHSDDYNRVFSSFTLRNIERVAMGGNKTVTTPRYAEDTYTGNIRLRYRFLPGADQTYVEMADAYRTYLLEGGVLKETEPAGHAPLFIEMIGAVRKQKFLLGIPYNSTVQATTIAQAGQIYDALKAAGMGNIQLLYSGLFRQGVKHGPLDKGALDGGLGGAQALKDLAKRLERNGDTLYPSIFLGRVYNTRGFSAVRNAARTHDGDTAVVYEASEPQLRGVPYFGSAYLSPLYLKDYTASVRSQLEKLGVTGVNVQDLGNTLVGTYKRREHVSPIHAVPYVESALELLNDQKLMLDCPNLYALPYADVLTNVPEQGNGYKLLDADIPFLQMVYDGCLTYSGVSWNLEPQIPLERQLLHAMEGKTAPRFTLTWEKPTIFHDTIDMTFLGYFSTWHEESLPVIQRAYEAYDAYYQQVADARIVRHDILSPTLRAVHFDNGVQLLLNYSDQEATADGITIPANGYILSGGE